MKKFIAYLYLTVLLFAYPDSVLSQQWHIAKQVNVAWTPSDGSAVTPPIPQNEISYYVYLSDAMTDPEKLTPSKIGATPNTKFQIIVEIPGRYFIGASAIRTVGGEVTGESDISWSDTGNTPWGIQYYIIPPTPTGLKVLS